MWYVYIIECKNRSFYTGITNNVEKRYYSHCIGKGARYTRMHEPLKLVYIEKKRTKSSALKREALIKSWSRQKKLDFVLTKQFNIDIFNQQNSLKMK